MKGTIIEASAGRSRGSPGWHVCLTIERKGFCRMVRHDVQFTKRDTERFWEGPDGWYLPPDGALAKACDDAVAMFTPWRTDASAGGVESGVAVKPSEAILGPPSEELQQRYYGQLLHFENLVAYLDEDAERRAKFGTDVLERLAKLEVNHRSCRAGGCCEIDREWGQCVKCGVELASEALDPTKPLYVGDGAPAVKRYEPDPVEPEEEAKL